LTFRGQLYDFQEEARQRAVDEGRFLFAMQMGLGKTPTAIATVETLFDEGEIDTCVVVVLASLKYQWQREIFRFTGKRALVIDGTKAQRARQYEWADKAHYVIMNYESIVNDWPTVKQFLTPQCIVIDEATAVKSPWAKRTKALWRLAKVNDTPYRFALTGQPIENKPEDLYSIMRFVDDSVLGDPEIFDRTFVVRNPWGKPIRYRNLPTLAKRMERVMVRRTRDDPLVRDKMPRVVQTTLPVRFSPAEAAIYRRIAQDTLDKLDEITTKFGGGFDLFANYLGVGDDSASLAAQGEVMARMLALRTVCDDVRLLVHSAKQAADENTKTGSAYALDLLTEEPSILAKIPPSSKLRVLVQFLHDTLDDNPEYKVVIFSTFKGALRLIQEATPKWQSVLYTGDMNARQKDAAKTEFKTDPHVRLLLSSDAGGYGVDIPEANYLVSFDKPWSTGKYEQRESRIIRLSSEWEHVNIVSMVVQGSIEERISDMLEQKKGIASAWVDGQYDERGRFELTLSSLGEFLLGSDV
jgi:SNF2 family DNA or RNA helicase